NDLLVCANITKTPVATDAELVAYSGFGPDDYFEQTYNSDLDFGTGDFYVMGWFRVLSGYNSTAYMMRRDRPALNGSGRIILRQSGTRIEFQITANAATSLPGIYNDGEFHFAVGMRVGTDVSLYIDGVEVATATDSSVVGGGGADHILALGAQPNGTGGAWTDSLALWRIGAGAPTDEQMAEIYEEEKALFNENARCTLQGSSSDVLALDQHK
ncbi:MAG: LamG domain-containing protein, partial [Gammaproteobacteria bacterium]|nr:LamG domain-containing protein [Gammaproteobacteria bacterium]